MRYWLIIAGLYAATVVGLLYFVLVMTDAHLIVPLPT